MGLVCLDLDGTIVKSALVEVDGKLRRMPENVYPEPTLAPNVYEVLERAALEGDSFAIVTNQGGVSLGLHTEAEVYQRIARAVALLKGFWASPFSIHVCFTHKRGYVAGYKLEGEDPRRKPGPGMILEAMNAHGFEQTDTLMVGDLGSDSDAALAAGVDFIVAGDYFTW